MSRYRVVYQMYFTEKLRNSLKPLLHSKQRMLVVLLILVVLCILIVLLHVPYTTSTNTVSTPCLPGSEEGICLPPQHTETIPYP